MEQRDRTGQRGAGQTRGGRGLRRYTQDLLSWDAEKHGLQWFRQVWHPPLLASGQFGPGRAELPPRVYCWERAPAGVPACCFSAALLPLDGHLHDCWGLEGLLSFLTPTPKSTSSLALGSPQTHA